MATKFSNTLQMSNSTDALFRSWVQFLDDLLLVTGLWTNTADTGQMTISTATHPAAANTKVGYRVYAMADTLQGTAPVFLRIDYGSGAGATIPGMWITIGSGSNGSGTITGIEYNGGATAAATVIASTAATSVCNSYGSADKNRVAALMFVRAAATDFMIFSLERSKDSSGNDTADGLLFGCMNNSSAHGIDTTQYIINGPGSQPPSELETGASVTLNNRSSSAFSSNTGVGVPLFFKSVPQQPGMNLVAVNDGDYVAEATFTMSMYGNTHTFQLGNSNTSQVAVPTGNLASVARANTRLGIRYE